MIWKLTINSHYFGLRFEKKKEAGRRMMQILPFKIDLTKFCL